MEVNLVEKCRALLSEPRAVATGLLQLRNAECEARNVNPSEPEAAATGLLSEPRAVATGLLQLRNAEYGVRNVDPSEPEAAAADFFPAQFVNQVHQKHSPHASGMICSGRQTVIVKLLTPNDAGIAETVINALKLNRSDRLSITSDTISIITSDDPEAIQFEKRSESEFEFTEKLGSKNDLYIIGGGHCALALSELMSKLDFRIRIFDDRPDLNTIDKNQFADEIKIIERYDAIEEFVPAGHNIYVVVMTLGYAFDEIVVRRLIDKDFRYFGVLGSRAKMKVLLRNLEREGCLPEKLNRIRTPIGIAINSRTPEEIAISIAAEIILVKNSVD